MALFAIGYAGQNDRDYQACWTPSPMDAEADQQG